jgi:hypothetical protein
MPLIGLSANCLSVICLSAQTRVADEIAGTWRGESTCVAKPTACQDETVVYRSASLPGRPGYFSANADKIVDGKAVNMGALEFRHNEDEHQLTCRYAEGTWQLTVDGTALREH